MADFKELRQKVSIAEAALSFLRLDLELHGEMLRGICPVCPNAKEKSLLVNPIKGTFNCYAEKVWGDVTDLTMHIMDCERPKAGELLAETFLKAGKPSKKQALPSGTQKAKDAQSAKNDSDRATEAGFPAKVCKAAGIKFVRGDTDHLVKVVWKKPVLIPVRDEDGNHLGDMAVTSAMLQEEWVTP